SCALCSSNGTYYLTLLSFAECNAFANEKYSQRFKKILADIALKMQHPITSKENNFPIFVRFNERLLLFSRDFK
ncbi:hypothetical protein, partial [Chryseobacterium sp. sg2396]